MPSQRIDHKYYCVRLEGGLQSLFSNVYRDGGRYSFTATMTPKFYNSKITEPIRKSKKTVSRTTKFTLWRESYTFVVSCVTVSNVYERSFIAKTPFSWLSKITMISVCCTASSIHVRIRLRCREISKTSIRQGKHVITRHRQLESSSLW